jgi:hypothetical protein
MYLKKQKIISVLCFFFAIVFYAISFIATKLPYKEDPCNIAITEWFLKDTSVSNHSFLNIRYSDTLVISTDTTFTLNWNDKTDSLCKIIATNCSSANKPILIINNRDTARSTWDTRFGKKVFFKRCP